MLSTSIPTAATEVMDAIISLFVHRHSIQAWRFPIAMDLTFMLQETTPTIGVVYRPIVVPVLNLRMATGEAMKMQWCSVPKVLPIRWR